MFCNTDKKKLNTSKIVPKPHDLLCRVKNHQDDEYVISIKLYTK